MPQLDLTVPSVTGVVLSVVCGKVTSAPPRPQRPRREGTVPVEPAVLVHLSDIHFTGKDDAAAARNHEMRRELMADLSRMQREDALGHATAIVVTGDIAYSATETEFFRAKEWLDEVAALVGTDNCQVLTVPGNHDVHWPAITTSARIARQQLRSCALPDITPLVDTLLEDSTDPLLAALGNYNEFALGYRCEVPRNGLPWQTSIALPHGYHLLVRGLTSVFNSDRDDTPTSLVIGRTQTVLPREPGAVQLLLVHHGPEDCRDRVEIRDRMRGKVSALLCGHKHDQRINRVNDWVEIVAGAVHPEEERGWDPTYNWLRLDVQPDDHGSATLILDVYQRVLRPEWNEFRSGHGAALFHREELPLAPLPAAPRGAHAPPSASGSPAGPSPAAVPPAAPAPLDPTPAAAPADGSAPPWTDGSTRAASGAPEGAEQRPPLVDEEGNVDADRRLTRDLLDLPQPDQERVLTQCGLLTNEDRTLGHVPMIRAALRRLTDDETRHRLGTLITAASAAHERTP